MLILISCAAAGFAAGFTETKKMAEAGDASAQYNLGVMYDNGDGTRKDSVEALKGIVNLLSKDLL